MKLVYILSTLATIAFVPFAQSDWVVDDSQSEITYLSTKVFKNLSGSATEKNTISGLSGTVTKSGKATFEIDLSTVDTLIPIRNERLLKFVFDVSTHGSNALLTADIPAAALTESSSSETISATLTIAGVSKAVELNVAVTKSGSDVLVTSTQPAIVKGSDFGLNEGFLKLTELAGLGYIIKDIPVSFSVKLSQK